MTGICFACPEHGRNGAWCKVHRREISTRTQGPNGGPTRDVTPEECDHHEK